MPLAELLVETGMRDREIESLWRSRRVWIAFAIVLALVAVFFLMGFIAMRDQLAREKQRPLEPNLGESPLQCAEGKWITQVGSWPPSGKQSTVTLVFGTLRTVQQRAEKHGVKVRLNYSSPDINKCKTVPSGYYILWSGPYADANAAKQICNELGWKLASDVGSCFGRTIDKDLKGKKHIRPDGVYW
jgi:hypothetical protein